MKMFMDKLAKNACAPQKSFTGWYIKNTLAFVWKSLEVLCVENSHIQPDHKVLEVGFGPGKGLSAAYDKIKNGKGKVVGLDISPYIIEEVSKRMSEGISKNQVEIYLGSVMDMPFDSNNFDRIFHCNSFYYWPDLNISTRELYRVLKPNSFIVTGIQENSVIFAAKMGLLKYGNPDLQLYLDALKQNKFENVYVKHVRYRFRTYQIITAYTGNKQE